eukprot:UN01345
MFQRLCLKHLFVRHPTRSLINHESSRWMRPILHNVMLARAMQSISNNDFIVVNSKRFYVYGGVKFYSDMIIDHILEMNDILELEMNNVRFFIDCLLDGSGGEDGQLIYMLLSDDEIYFVSNDLFNGNVHVSAFTVNGSNNYYFIDTFYGVDVWERNDSALYYSQIMNLKMTIN